MAQSLTEVLLQRIKADGPISVHDYMELALGHPQLGYYVSQPAFGAEGDFVTAPEISQTFGELIGLWAAEVWIMMGKPSPFNLVELGPGRGTLLADALRLLSKALPEFLEAADVHLVELSPKLKAAQKEALTPFSSSLTWHDDIATVPDGPLVLIANEFLDALPIRQFVRSHDGWRERMIGEGIGGSETLGFCLAPEITKSASLARFGTPMVESIAEVRPRAEALMGALSTRLASSPGAALFLDYGHRDSAVGDTFQAVKNHLPVHVLQMPGQADLTAHVDFQALKEAASATPSTGLQTQGDFLRELGIETRLQQLLESAREDQKEILASGVSRLIDEKQMGSLFRAICFHSEDLPPPGFDGVSTS